MKKLHNITLVAMTSVDISATIQALEYSCRNIEFGKVKIISNIIPYNLPNYIIHQPIHPITSIDQWNYSVIYELGNYVDTEFAILAHADGFVVNPDSWRDDFLDYDYIGAPWPLPKDNFSFRDISGKIIRVGNSVSLRSKRLIDLPAKIELEWKPFHGFYNEDGFICVNYRHEYTKRGLRFADIDVAKYFSHETMIPEIKNLRPFMFHRYAGTNAIYPKFK